LLIEACQSTKLVINQLEGKKTNKSCSSSIYKRYQTQTKFVPSPNTQQGDDDEN
jgi:hypothetical protein